MTPDPASARASLRTLWALARPYWFSEERWVARGLLAAVVLLNLGLVGINVLLNRWNAAFFNALQDKDFPAFLHARSRPVAGPAA